MALYRIPYVFQAAATLKRHRNIEPYMFGAWTEAEIPHVSSDEAPVALAWEEQLNGRNPVRHVTRWHEGQNWVPADMDIAYRSRASFTPDDLGRLPELEHQSIRDRRGFSHLQALANATGQDYYRLRRFVVTAEVPGFKDTDIREVHHSDRVETEELVLKGCRNLLFIDDQLWIGGYEPCYAASALETAAASVKVATPGNNWRNVLSIGLFRADRLDDAADFAREISGNPDADVTMERIEIIIPEAVTFADEEHAILQAGSQALSKAVRNLHLASTESLIVWAALRDGLARSDICTEEAARLLVDLAKAFPHNHDIGRIADIATRRWNMRPLNLNPVL